MNELFFVTQSFIDLKNPGRLNCPLFYQGNAILHQLVKTCHGDYQCYCQATEKKGRGKKKTMRYVIDIVEIFLILKDRENKRIGWK